MHVVIRADGGPRRGYGHLTRTAVLARELLSQGHRVTYLTLTPDAARDVRPEGVGVEQFAGGGTATASEHDGDEGEADAGIKSEADAVVARARDLDADALVVDLGERSLSYQRRVADAIEAFVLVLDDTGATVCCDLLVNGHVYASPADYSWVGAEPAWYVGGEYYFLDESFRALARRSPIARSPPERALITMGGSDVGNATPTAMAAFDGRDLAVDVVVGPGFTNRDEIAATAETVDCRFDVVENPDDLPRRLFETDFAVTALGLTAYELAAVGTPFVGTVQAPDQRPKAKALADAEAALVLGDADRDSFEDAVDRLASDDQLRRELRRRAGDLVGTDGVGRVRDGLESLVEE